MLTGGIAQAGVIVEEQQTADHGMGAPTTNEITVMVQGSKQKSVSGDRQQITDLDQGKRMIILDARKIYVEMPFPPTGMTMPPGAAKSGLSFKSTGGHEKIAGYSCDDYSGSGAFAGNEVTIDGCFSTSAPGAANFTTFQKAISAKVKNTPMALTSDAPPGIPLKIDTTFKQVSGGRPPIVTHMKVTKVTEQNLPAETFEAPRGYTKQPMPMMGMRGPGMMGKSVGGTSPAPPASAPSKSNVPE
jgi:hypothetical protein